MGMTNFAQTMHDWQRMCKYYDKLYNTECCNNCRLENCGAIWEMDDTTNWEDYERVISIWASEHKEPIYPSWREYLKKMGLTTPANVYFSDEYGAGVKVNDVLNEKADCPISAEIATALGLEPRYE